MAGRIPELWHLWVSVRVHTWGGAEQEINAHFDRCWCKEPSGILPEPREFQRFYWRRGSK